MDQHSDSAWGSGSHGGSRGDYSQSQHSPDHEGSRESRPYRGSYGNSYSRGGGGGGGGSGGSYGFRRDQRDNQRVEIQKDTIFIQDLPKDITKEQLQDVFSSAGRIKIDDRSGGPKVWIYKDRNTDEGNGRATVTYEDEDTASRAINQYNDQHIDSLGVTVRVQQAQRRFRGNDRGGYGGDSRGYRGGRSGWDSSYSRSGGFNSDGNRWGGSRGGFSDNRGGGSGRGSYRGRGGGDSYRNSDDRDDFQRGGSSHQGASRGRGGFSNYTPY